VETNHPGAAELLDRDLSNVLRFFERRYKIDMHLEDALSVVKGASKEAV
jgi:RIO kinase 2